MSDSEIEHPRTLLSRLRLGREEYCQRLLTMLILEGAYPRWNSRSRPSLRGLEFLRLLDGLSFGEARLGVDLDFVDELDLPARDTSERGCAPDYGVVSPDRLWMIELKTEAASHRPAQLPAYAALGAHHFPGIQHDLTYLTPALHREVPAPSGVRFAHLTWADVVPLIVDVWGAASGNLGACRDGLLDAIESIGQPWTAWRAATLQDIVASAVGQARQTASDGLQRAVEHEAGSLDTLYERRMEINDALNSAGEEQVRAWVWRAESSGGAAMTQGGLATGYEIRLSQVWRCGSSVIWPKSGVSPEAR